MHNQAWDPGLFGQILGQVCEEADLSQADLARLSGKSQSTVSRWTNSRNQPNHDAIKRLAISLEESYPRLGDLPRQLMAAAGYALTPVVVRGASTRQAAQHVLAVLRSQAQSKNLSLAALLISEGLAEPDDLAIPDALAPDEMIDKITALEIPDEDKAKLIRMHLENQALRFEEQRLSRKKPDDGTKSSSG